MQNLINAINAQYKGRLNDFILEINQVQDVKQLRKYNDLLPKGKDVSNFTLNALRGYLIIRKEKSIYKSIEREVSKIKAVYSAGELVSAKISVEWTKNRTWGANPKGEAWVTYKDKSGSTGSNYVTSGSIGGCGYDKLSTSVAECLNQFNEVLKLMYAVKDAALATTPTISNNDLLSYGSGYGILPSIEGGVGVSCYDRIFNKLGYTFETVATGKTFDVFEITKL